MLNTRSSGSSRATCTCTCNCTCTCTFTYNCTCMGHPASCAAPRRAAMRQTLFSPVRPARNHANVHVLVTSHSPSHEFRSMVPLTRLPSTPSSTSLCLLGLLSGRMLPWLPSPRYSLRVKRLQGRNCIPYHHHDDCCTIYYGRGSRSSRSALHCASPRP